MKFGQIELPELTTAQRDALSPDAPTLIWNTEVRQVQIFDTDASVWSGFAGNLSSISLQNSSTNGSTNSNIPIYTSIPVDQGNDDLTYITDAANGDHVLVNTPGTYSITAGAQPASGAGTNRTLAIEAGPATAALDNALNAGPGGAYLKALFTNAGAGLPSGITWVGNLNAGDRVWAHIDGAPSALQPARQVFTITKLA